MNRKDYNMIGEAYNQVFRRSHKLLSEAEASSYVVQRGDNLSLIAHKFGIDFEELKTANKITDPNAVTVGTELIIPSSAKSNPNTQSDKLNNFIKNLPKDFPDEEVHDAPVGRNQEGYITLQPNGQMPLSKRKRSPEGQGGYQLK
jgi:LysM repeat protein